MTTIMWLQFVLWILILVAQAGEVALATFMTSLFIDYEDDVGPSSADLSKRLSTLHRIEFLVHGLTFGLLLLVHRPEVAALNAPILGYHLYQFYTGAYVIDPDRLWKTVGTLKFRTFIKLGVYVVFLVTYVVLAVMHFVDIGWKPYEGAHPVAFPA
eukprot:TRINITY_DN823_c0_g1_i1.p2 TRINITY_DN823_c0_g1~~TRINITY_DN823_c0_g1_i1.p2  ORF type:complete len:156 (+),score=57.07 TRINITY_DN823_c0_g1_i1:35-502(+)